MTVKDDRAKFDRLMRELRQFDDVEVAVGVFDGKHPESDAFRLPQIAAAHEFGTQNIPQRSFLAGTIDDRRNAFERAIDTIVQQTVGLRIGFRQALNQLGLFSVGEIQDRMADGISPDLAETTKERRRGQGPFTPLIDTGTLRRSIRHKLRRRGAS